MTIIKELDALHVNGEEYKFPAGEGDMKYADFSLVEKTGATVTLDLFSYVEPSANFTVNAPSEIKEGQEYILRVENGATAYTMTLGANIENPYLASTTLTANGIDQFTFLAVDGKLELQPEIIKYSAGNNITINSNGVISAVPYVAGKNIQIGEGNVISTVDPLYYEGDNITIGRAIATVTPVELGYHIPTNEERDALRGLFTTLGITKNGTNLGIYFKMPCSGRRDEGGTVQTQGTEGHYWSSSYTKISSYGCAYYFGFLTRSFYGNGTCYITYGYTIRSFKDTPVIPDNSWTTLYDGSSVATNAGIYYNPTLGLISASGDGVTWFTMKDKNEGATAVYNNGDTLSEANCGKYYQWGNCHGFPRNSAATITTSTESASLANYGPGNYYSSSMYEQYATWDTSYNGTLWNTGNIPMGNVISAKDTTYTAGTGLTLSNNEFAVDTATIATKGYVDDNVVQKSATAPSSPTEGMVWYDTTNDVLKTYDGTNWNECGGGSGDMLYADFNWVTKTGATITLDLNSYIEPSADFTVNAPSTIEDGQRYILRVVTGATPYTMTLGTGITNPYSESTTLLANTVHQFGFLAVDGNLELQPSVTQSGGGTWGTITGTLSNQTDLQTALNAKANASDVNTKLFRLSSNSDLTTAQAAYDWRAAGKNPIITHGDGGMMRVLYSASTTRLEFVAEGYYSNGAVTPNGNISEKGLYVTYIIANSSGVVTSITAGEKDYIRYLNTNVNYPTPYIPQYDGSPATKKYVDDNVAYVGSSAPSSPSEGKLWYDTTNDVLKSYDGTNWNECGGGGVNKSWVTKTISSGEIELGIRTLVNDPSANFTLTKPATLIDGEEYAIRINSGSTARTMTLGTGFTNPWNVSLSLNAQATDQFVFLAINNTLELQPLITIS